MRNEAEVRKIHDTLNALVVGELPLVLLTERDQEAIQNQLAALCWVLNVGCEAGDKFAGNMAELQRCIKEAGYEIYIPRDN